jgi:CheY-like chemotaxis protein
MEPALNKKKVFIADPSRELIDKILASKEAKEYHIEFAHSGEETLKKIKTFKPDLIIMDLLLPEMHGIEVLRAIRSDPQFKDCGVIISTDHILIQNYHAAIREGANYFLNKPFSTEYLFSLVKRFFFKELFPEPFHGVPSENEEGQHCYVPKMHRPNHYLRFWGTRGSNAVSGSQFLRFGGNTCCLEVRHNDDSIIIDAGTGICSLAAHSAIKKSAVVHLFFSHTHWDHITGFPFFPPIYDTECQIHVYAPFGFEKTPKELFTDMLAYTYFPVRLDDIQAKITFHTLEVGRNINVGQIEISSQYTLHPGATLGFKIKAGTKTFAYITDNEFLMGFHGHPNSIEKDSPLLLPHLSLVEFLKGCDFVIHEAQFFPVEYLSKVGWGHSSVSNAAVLMKLAGVKEWIVTHHDPSHTDEDLQKKYQLQLDILRECKIDCSLQFAYDGLIYPL